MTGLRLSPHRFWALSLNEWRWLLPAGLGAAHEAMDAAALNALLLNYPDKHP